jgi:Flp pilus assembly protein TadG
MFSQTDFFMKRIRSDRSGAAGIEFGFVAPLLILLLLASFTTFDLFRAANIADKSTFTIGDFISRQTEATDSVFGQAKAMMQRLARNDVGNPQIRISSVMRTSEGFTVQWTYNSENGELSKSKLDTQHVPDIAINDSVIVTETIVKVNPFMAVSIGRDNGLFTFEHRAVTRPRFVGRIARP